MYYDEWRDVDEWYARSLCLCYLFGNAVELWPEISDFGCRRLFWQDGSVFEVPPLIVDSDGGWCVSCHYVAGECNDVAVKRGPVGVGEREFLYTPQDSGVARWLCDNDEEIWPLLLRQGC